ESLLNPAFLAKGIQMVRYGSLFWFHLKTPEPVRRVNQIPAGQKEFFKGLFTKTLAQGIYLAPHAYEVGFLSLAHTEDILSETASTILGALEGT
ncbi:MAG: glutamate-1-semialdehyde 2,1-aminomutase, partial [Pseudobdellovibrionaceae bacterium]